MFSFIVHFETFHIWWLYHPSKYNFSLVSIVQQLIETVLLLGTKFIRLEILRNWYFNLSTKKLWTPVRTNSGKILPPPPPPTLFCLTLPLSYTWVRSPQVLVISGTFCPKAITYHMVVTEFRNLTPHSLVRYNREF